MKSSDFIWNEYVHGGHLLSIGSSAIVLTVMFILEVQIRFEFLLIVYLGTQCIYSYNHYKEIEFDSITNLHRTTHLNSYNRYQDVITIFYGSIFLLLLIYYGNTNSFLFGCILLILGLFFTYRGKTLSKKIVGFKSVYTAFSWSLIVIFTSIYCSYPIDLIVLLLFLFVFMRWIINTSFFDIKDIKSDKKREIKTMPLYFGKDNFLDLLQILNLLSIFPILIGVLIKQIPIYAFLLTFTFFYSFYYIQKARSKKTQITNLSYIFVDSEFFYWPFLVLLGFILIQI